MKKSALLIAFVLLSLTPFAQKGKDYITKKANGKVYWIRSGQTIQMAIDVPLKNGSTVNYKGDIKDKDGNITQQLQNGDKVLMDGTYVKAGKKAKA